MPPSLTLATGTRVRRSGEDKGSKGVSVTWSYVFFGALGLSEMVRRSKQLCNAFTVDTIGRREMEIDRLDYFA